MKKKKLKLHEFKVSSFVTQTDKIKGGAAIDLTSTDIFGTRLAECGADSHVFCSGDVMCDPQHTFMYPNTDGCKHSDMGPCKTNTLPGL